MELVRTYKETYEFTSNYLPSDFIDGVNIAITMESSTGDGVKYRGIILDEQLAKKHSKVQLEGIDNNVMCIIKKTTFDGYEEIPPAKETYEFTSNYLPSDFIDGVNVTITMESITGHGVKYRGIILDEQLAKKHSKVQLEGIDNNVMCIIKKTTFDGYEEIPPAKIRYKFKYIPHKVAFKPKYLKEVHVPSDWLKDLPDGKYLIKGNRKYHAKLYIVLGGVWFLADASEKEIDYFYLSIDFMQLPNHSEKEWGILANNYKCLSKTYKRYVDAYRLNISIKRHVYATKLHRRRIKSVHRYFRKKMGKA